MYIARFYKWRAKFDGMNTSMVKPTKELGDENLRRKKMYAEEHLKAELLWKESCKAISKQ